MQGNIIAICLYQLVDQFQLLRQWLALCLAKVKIVEIVYLCHRHVVSGEIADLCHCHRVVIGEVLYRILLCKGRTINLQLLQSTMAKLSAGWKAVEVPARIPAVNITEKN